MSEFVSELTAKMKNRGILVFLGLALAVLVGCASTTSNNSIKQPESNKIDSYTGKQPDPNKADSDNSKLSASSGSAGQVPSGQDGAKQTNSNSKASIYFTGSGGKGMSLGILVPASRGLNANQEYLPSMVQGGLVSNISKYSAITVLDRVSLDRVIAETLDPTYKDNLDIVSLGHVAQVGYMMTGNIMRTSTGYTLQLNVTETSPNASTIASYSGAYTVAQFDDFSAIHLASKELLTQMGVQLTDTAVYELEKPDSSQAISAQTNLARGIIAQQRGTTVEAMAYYYNAVSFDPKLSEATGRLSTLSSNITSGNIGANVRNDIQRRKVWLDLLKECEDYFTKHLPYEIVYSPDLVQGEINYNKETVSLSFNVTVKPTEWFKVVDNILQGLNTTDKKYDWGIGDWPMTSRKFVDEYSNVASYYSFFDGSDHYWKYSSLYNHSSAYFLYPNSGEKLYPYDDGGRKNTVIRVQLFNDKGKMIATTEKKIQNKLGFRFLPSSPGRDKGFWDSSRILVFSQTDTVVFNNVNANDITDNLTIKIISVNGVDIAKNPDYIRITAK